MRISVQTLMAHEACEEQVELFEKFLGKRKFILDTPKNIRLAAKFGMEIQWAIPELGLRIPDGPLEDSSGDIRWYLNGKLHRTDGPAKIQSGGAKAWYQNGLLHRKDGPALIWENGFGWWYLNGIWQPDQE